MKNLTVAIIMVLAGCASEKIYHTQTSNPSPGPSAAGLSVLVSRNARIEGSELVWSCVYQTSDGRVVIEQHDECELTH